MITLLDTGSLLDYQKHVCTELESRSVAHDIDVQWEQPSSFVAKHILKCLPDA